MNDLIGFVIIWFIVFGMNCIIYAEYNDDFGLLYFITNINFFTKIIFLFIIPIWLIWMLLVAAFLISLLTFWWVPFYGIYKAIKIIKDVN